jgi:hypothetical protein
LGYLLGNLSLEGIELKCSQSKGIADLGPLGQELEQLEKQPNRGRFKEVLGGKVTSQRDANSSYVTPNKNPQETPSKLHQENHKKELRKSTKGENGRDNTRP